MLLISYWNKFISHKYLVIALISTLAVSSVGLSNGWVNRDDDQYILKNSLVQGDIAEEFVHFFTQPVMGNYHPITMFSLKLDQIIWGNNPAGYHFTSVLFHGFNVLLAYIFFYLLMGNGFSAGLIALLFGIHPMHVESVAWISARKDVLYVAFLLVGLISWVQYTRDTSNNKYRKYSMISSVMSLLCKPMAVIFPLLLLLIDYKVKRRFSLNLLMEKSIFFILSLSAGILVIATQKSSGALDAIDGPTFLEKLNFVSYGLNNYLFKSVLPLQLSAFHPYPDLENALPWLYKFSMIFSLIFIGLMIKLRHDRSVVFGMGIFIVSIGPVLQLLTFGDAIIAERYTYFSYFGLFFMIAYGLEKIQSKYSIRTNNIIRLLVLGALLSYGAISMDRYGVWENGETLWSDVIKKYPDDYLAYGTRANYYIGKGNLDVALVDYNKSIELNPKFVGTLTNRGLIHRRMGSFQAAMIDFDQVILLSPSASAYLNRGLLFRDMKAYDKSLSDFSKAITYDPHNAQAFVERGFLQTQMNNYGAAIVDYTSSIELQPKNGTAYFYRGDTYCLMNQLPLGIEDFTKAIQLNPNNARAYFFRSRAFEASGNLVQAKDDALEADKLGYDIPDGYLEGLE